MKTRKPPFELLACYTRNVYRVHQPAGVERGYVVIECAGYRTIFPVPKSVVIDLARSGVRRIGPRHGFESRSAAILAIRKLRGRS